MEDTQKLNLNIEALLKLFAKLDVKSPKPGKDSTSEEPRKVVKEITSVKIEDLSDSVKKFFKGIFSFELPDSKQQIKKASNFWQDLLTLIGGSLLGLYEYFKNRIVPQIELTWALLEKTFKFIAKEAAVLLKFLEETKIGATFEEWWGSFLKLFSEDGVIGKIFNPQNFTKIIAFIKDTSFFKFFSENGLVVAFFEKVNILAKLVSKALEVVSFILIPIFAAITGYEAYSVTLKEGGDLFSAKFKGWMAFITNILTLGFINFEDIKESLNSLLDTVNTGDSLKTVEDSILFILEAIGKIPFKAVQMIVGLFDKEASIGIQAWISEFNLIEILTPYLNVMNDFITTFYDGLFDVISEGWGFITKNLQNLKDIFNDGLNTKNIVQLLDSSNPMTIVYDALKRVISIIKDLFSPEKIKQMGDHFKELLPIWFGGKDQDIIISPALPVPQRKEKSTVTHITSENTLTPFDNFTENIVASEPIEKLLNTSIDVTKTNAETAKQQNESQIKLLAKNNDLLTQLIQILANQPKNTNQFNSFNSNTNMFKSDSGGIQGFRQMVQT